MIFRKRPKGAQLPLIGGGAQQRAVNAFNTHGTNEMVNKAVTIDVLYFAPAPDIDRPIQLGDILANNNKALQEAAELVDSIERGADPAAAKADLMDILTRVAWSAQGYFSGVQRFTYGNDDIAETPDNEINAVTDRINGVETEFRQSARSTRDPRFYNILLNRVVELAFGETQTRAKDLIQLNFIAAHGLGRDPEAMIRAVPFPMTRLFLLNWMYENHGPMAVARIAHAPKGFDVPAGAAPVSALRH